MLKSIKCERRLRSLAAFSLVEVTLALGIAAFCLIAVFGLVPDRRARRIVTRLPKPLPLTSWLR